LLIFQNGLPPASSSPYLRTLTEPSSGRPLTSPAAAAASAAAARASANSSSGSVVGSSVGGGAAGFLPALALV
jgi:hypothetical protein